MMKQLQYGRWKQYSIGRLLPFTYLFFSVFSHQTSDVISLSRAKVVAPPSDENENSLVQLKGQFYGQYQPFDKGENCINIDR